MNTGREWQSGQEQPTVLIAGDTYRVREELKALGGRWDPEARAWRVPAERAAEARNLVDNCAGQMGFAL